MNEPGSVSTARLRSIAMRGKLFIKDVLAFYRHAGLVQQTAGRRRRAVLSPTQGNEEAYIFMGGEGQMQIDGEVFPVQEGTIVRVNTDGSRSLRNTSGNEPLYFLCIQARQNSLNIDTFEDGIRSEQPVVWPE
ncbi:MAG: hypothetical protein U0105_25860 [Candidatus Obscuribacterales bacterium]